jgi:SulP family sulfate permease
MGIAAVTVSAAFAALIFSGELADSISQGIGLMLVGSMITASLAALFSSMRGVVVHLQRSAVSILAAASVVIVSQMPVSSTADEKFVTVAMAIALSSILTGGLFLTLGGFRLGNLIRFIPYPVIGGFLSGSALLLALESISLIVGTRVNGILFLSYALQPGFWTKLLPGLCFAVILLVALRRQVHTLVIPGIILTGLIGFYIFLGATNTSIVEAAQQGLLLGVSGGVNGVLWQLPKISDLALVDWSALGNQIGSLFFVAIVSVVAILLNASGIELATGQDVDLNRDLKSAGVANLVAGLAGGISHI